MNHNPYSLIYRIRRKLSRLIKPEAYFNTLLSKVGTYVAKEQIEGDYLEFGCSTGQSFAEAYHSISQAYRINLKPSIWNNEKDIITRKSNWEKMRFFAFDSFEGLPELKGIDSLSKVFVKGKYKNSENNFIEFIKSKGIGLNKVQVIPGWYKDTLNDNTKSKYNLRKAAIVFIDSDLYHSAKLVLNFISDLLVEGTIIVFDDWFSFKGNPKLGEQKAFKEWQEANPDWIVSEYQKDGIWRNSFILNKKDLSKL